MSGRAPPRPGTVDQSALESTIELLSRAGRGDTQAATRLCERYRSPLHAWAVRRIPDWARPSLDADALIRTALNDTTAQCETVPPHVRRALQVHLRDLLQTRIKEGLNSLRAGGGGETPSEMESKIGRARLDSYEAALQRLDARDRVAIVSRIELAEDWERVTASVGAPSVEVAKETVAGALLRLAGASRTETEHRRLFSLARAVAEGAPVAWDDEMQRAQDDRQRAWLEQLRVVERIAEASTHTCDSMPERLGDFDIVREIGRGGMGVVYEARQVSLDRRVALKVLSAGLGLNTQAVRRFEREARAAANLHHTNIVPVFAIGEQRGQHYYAMDLVEGQALDRILGELRGGRGNLLLGETGEMAVAHRAPGETTTAGTADRQWFDVTARLLAEVAKALDYAHDHGVIHRDIKPANLLFSAGGKLSITDFGLARLAEQPGLTVTGSLLGTPAYMSPEQISSHERLDHRTDVYSLGVVLYEMLTLRLPFMGRSHEQVLQKIVTEDPVPPRRINPRVPRDLETICLKALEKDPARRYATAGELSQDLRQYLRRDLISARRSGILRRAWKLARRHPVPSTAALALLLIGVVGGLAVRSTLRTKEEGFRRAIAEAERDLDAGLYQQAAANANRAVALDPDAPTARLLRARALMHLSPTREVIDDARFVLEHDPDEWFAHVIIAAAGETFMPDIPTARHLLSVEADAPQSAEAYYLRALSSRSTDERLELLNRALELDPGHGDALLRRIYVNIGERKDFAAAHQDCERLIVARPRVGQGRRMHAFTYRAQRDYDRALATINQAVESTPDDVGNLWGRGEILRDMGRLAESAADLTRAVELEPWRPAFHVALADTLNRMGRHEEAAIEARAGIDLDPARNRWGYPRLLWALWRLERHQDLRAVLEELRAKSGRWVDSDAVAWTERLIDQYETWLTEAKHPFQPPPPRRPGDFLSYMEHARGEPEIGELCRFIGALQLEDAGDLVARGNLLRDACERPGSALDDFSAAIAIAPDSAEPYRGLGLLHWMEGDPEQALLNFNKAVAVRPAWSAALRDRARVYASQGRWQDALADLDRCLGYTGEDQVTLRDRAVVLSRLNP